MWFKSSCSGRQHYRHPTPAPTSCSTSRQTHEKKFLHPQTNILMFYTSLMFIQPPHTQTHYFPSFHHLILQAHPLPPLPCPSLSISISYLLLPSSSFPLSCHPPVCSYPGRMQPLLNGGSTECNCFVNNSTGTKVRDRATL